MPRPADFKSGNSLTIHASTPAEADQIKAFKELHARNNLSMRQTILESVELFLRKHHYPPGNSQTLLFSGVLEERVCVCGLKATRKVVLPNNEVVFCCSGHMPKSVRLWKQI